MADEMEFGWVIEHHLSPGYAPLYWAGDGWSINSLDAIRYSREEDAKKTVKFFGETYKGPHRLAQHGWG